MPTCVDRFSEHFAHRGPPPPSQAPIRRRVTSRRGRFGTVEFRLGRHVLGMLPLGGLVDERTIIQRMRDAYERAQDRLDRGAGVMA